MSHRLFDMSHVEYAILMLDNTILRQYSTQHSCPACGKDTCEVEHAQSRRECHFAEVTTSQTTSWQFPVAPRSRCLVRNDPARLHADLLWHLLSSSASSEGAPTQIPIQPAVSDQLHHDEDVDYLHRAPEDVAVSSAWQESLTEEGKGQAVHAGSTGRRRRESKAG